jgi:RNA polymerase sigma-70 factor, ECF subfamily
VIRRNPLANVDVLVPRVFAFVAYRLGDGPDADDVTSEVFERALRYEDSYDPRLGTPIAWLIGIARRCIAEANREREAVPLEVPEQAAPEDLEAETIRRLTLFSAMKRLSDRERELLAMRYGADLTTREIAELFDAQTNAVDVAIHRALARLRERMEITDRGTSKESGIASPTQHPVTRPSSGT